MLIQENKYVTSLAKGTGLTAGNCVADSSGTAIVTTGSNRPVGMYVGDVYTIEGDITTNVQVDGIVSGLSGLTPGTVYYAGADGALTATANAYPVGVGLTGTDLLLLLPTLHPGELWTGFQTVLASVSQPKSPDSGYTRDSAVIDVSRYTKVEFQFDMTFPNPTSGTVSWQVLTVAADTSALWPYTYTAAVGTVQVPYPIDVDNVASILVRCSNTSTSYAVTTACSARFR